MSQFGHFDPSFGPKLKIDNYFLKFAQKSAQNGTIIRIFHSSIPNLKLKMVDIIFWSTDFGGQSYRFTHDRPFVSQEFLVETAHTIFFMNLVQSYS